jgi:hypothetical protein
MCAFSKLDGPAQSIIEELTLPQTYSPEQHSFLLKRSQGNRISPALVHIDDARNGIRRAAKHLTEEALCRSCIPFGRE